jgi:transcriptional regulator with XRE-family HTH domain
MARKVTLAGARVTAKLTQEQMATKMGVTRRTISAWENGETVIGIAQLIAWCTVTGFKMEDISLPSESTLSEV